MALIADTLCAGMARVETFAGNASATLAGNVAFNPKMPSPHNATVGKIAEAALTAALARYHLTCAGRDSKYHWHGGKRPSRAAALGADALDGVALTMASASPAPTADAVAQGIYLVPEERRTVITCRNRSDRILHCSFAGIFAACFIPKSKKQLTAKVLKRLLQPPRPEIAVRTLSGGNQQKIVIGNGGQSGRYVPLFALRRSNLHRHKAKRDV